MRHILEKLQLNKQTEVLGDTNLIKWADKLFNIINSFGNWDGYSLKAVKSSFRKSPISSCSYKINRDDIISFCIDVEDQCKVKTINCATLDVERKFKKFIYDNVNKYIGGIEIRAFADKNFKVGSVQAKTKESVLMIEMMEATTEKSICLFIGNTKLLDKVIKVLKNIYDNTKMQHPEDIITIETMDYFLK